MSAFNKVAPALTTNVSGIFGIASADPSAVKEGVVANLRQTLGASFGNDAKPSLSLGM